VSQVCFFLFAAASLFYGTVQAHAQQRVVLVMDVQNYTKVRPSAIGAQRGDIIAQAFKDRGFTVIQSTNPTNAEARATLGDFSVKVGSADLALAVLLGHGLTSNGQTFFLPANAEIDRATDLMSRSLSITNIANIVGHAKVGGVFFLMTNPGFEPSIADTDKNPAIDGDLNRNVVSAFSTSSRVPLSRIDALAADSADALAKVLKDSSVTFDQAVKAASGGGLGLVVGAVPDLALNVPHQTIAVASPDGTNAAAPSSELIAERQAREAAEKRARDEKANAEKARAEAEQSKSEARQIAEQAMAKLNEEEARLNAMEKEHQKLMGNTQPSMAASPSMKADEESRIAAIEKDHRSLMAKTQPMEGQAGMNARDTLSMDAQLGPRQRMLIQQRLAELGLYSGKMDSLFGPLTREAIMGYQRAHGDPITGYLTPEEYKDLSVAATNMKQQAQP
jgi:hypothetical protein